jgi:hypothetical protein
MTPLFRFDIHRLNPLPSSAYQVGINFALSRSQRDEK